MFLFVLAKFNEDFVFPFLEFGREDVLVDPLSSMIFGTGEEKLSIEPDLPCILATQSELQLAILGKLKSIVGVGNDLLQLSVF